MLTPQPEPTSSATSRNAPVRVPLSDPNDFAFRAVDAFLRHIWLFFLCFGVVTGIVCAALLLRERSYTASVSTQVVKQSIAQELSTNNSGWDETATAGYHVARFNDLSADNRENGFMDTALRDAALITPINLDPRKGDIERYNKLRRNMSVNAESDKVFTVSLVWDDPEECARIVESLQRQYVDAVGAGQQASSLATVAFYTDQIGEYEKQLQKVESALIEYKSKNFGQLPSAQDSDIKQYAALQQQLAQSVVLMQGNRQKAEALTKRLQEVKPTIVGEQTLGTSPTAQQLQIFKNMRSTLKATKGYTDDAEGLQDLNRQISELETQRANELDEAQREVNEVAGGGSDSSVLQSKVRPNPEYTSLQMQLTEADINRKTQEGLIEQLKKQVAQFRTRVERIPADQKELNDRTRDSAVVKKQYDVLVEKRGEALIKASLDKLTAQSSLRQIGAIRPESTINKKKTVLLLGASVFLGLLVGACMIVFSEWADTSVRYASDASRFFDVPLLSSVSRQPDWMREATKKAKKR